MVRCVAELSQLQWTELDYLTHSALQKELLQMTYFLTFSMNQDMMNEKVSQ